MSQASYSIDHMPPEQGEEERIRAVPRVSIQAFCEQAETATALESIFDDRHLYRAHTKLHMGGLNAALEFYSEAPTPNLIILESLARSNEMLHQLEQLAEVCDPGTKVIVIGSFNDVQLYREMIRQGVTEYLVTPLDPRLVVQLISGAFAESQSKSFGKLIAFIGAKGGVGSSTIAHNVAFDIAQDYQQDVVLADLDLAYGTAGLNLNQDPVHGIAEAVFSPDRLDDTVIYRLLCKCTDHLSLLAAPALLDREYDFDKSSFDGILDTVRSKVPYTVLDVPHGWCSWTKQVLMSADDIVITVIPDLANLRNAKNMIETLKAVRKNDTPPRIVINQSGMLKRPEISVADFTDSLEIEPIAVVPFDAMLFGTAANNGQMLAEASANAKPTEILRQLAHSLSGRAAPKQEKMSPLQSILKQMQFIKRK